MIILALETATRAGSLAIATDDGQGPAQTGDPSRTHGVRLPAEILTFLAGAGLSLPQVDTLAVVIGPGSFTGLRVGLATIQGLALARDVKVIGIPTLEAMASGWLDANGVRDAWVVTCLDGARGDVFYALYDVSGATAVERARELIAVRVAPPGEAAADVAAMPGRRSVVLVGDGAERHAATWLAALPGATIAAPMPNLAAAAARLAARRRHLATPPHALRPIYVRRPDAVLARERAARDDADLVVFEVRSAEDLAGAAALQERAFGRAWEAEALVGETSNGNVTPRLYAARHSSGAIVAYCAAWQVLDELHINSLAVDDPHRRKGIGVRLMREVLVRAARSGARSATLEVRASNRAGRALYERLGFRVEGARRGYYQNPPEDALVMWLRDVADVRT